MKIDRWKCDEVEVDVLVLLGHQRAGQAAGHGGDDEGQDLVAIDRDAHRRRRRPHPPAATEKRGRTGLQQVAQKKMR